MSPRTRIAPHAPHVGRPRHCHGARCLPLYAQLVTQLAPEHMYVSSSSISVPTAAAAASMHTVMSRDDRVGCPRARYLRCFVRARLYGMSVNVGMIGRRWGVWAGVSVCVCARACYRTWACSLLRQFLLRCGDVFLQRAPPLLQLEQLAVCRLHAQATEHATVSVSAAGVGQVQAPMRVSPGADVAESVPAPMWVSPSRRRCGPVGPGHDRLQARLRIRREEAEQLRRRLHSDRS
jgi:hypothetical protein